MEEIFSLDTHLFLIDGSLHDHHMQEEFRKISEELTGKSLVVEGSKGSNL